MSTENYSLLNKKLDPTSSLWKKKYTLLLKRSENVEKQNLRLINRLYQIKKITQRLNMEKKFLMRRLDRYNDDFRNTKFYIDSELLPEGSSEYLVKKKSKKGNLSNSSIIDTTEVTSPEKPLGIPPKKPMSAFFRYCQAQHLQILKENSGMSHDEIKKSLAEKWNAMGELEKEIYYESFEEDRDGYEKEMNHFLSNFKMNAETSGISHTNDEEQEEPEEEEGEEEEDERNSINIKKEEESPSPKEAQNSDCEKMEEDLRHLDEPFNSSLSEDQGSISSDEQNDENG